MALHSQVMVLLIMVLLLLLLLLLIVRVQYHKNNYHNYPRPCRRSTKISVTCDCDISDSVTVKGRLTLWAIFWGLESGKCLNNLVLNAQQRMNKWRLLALRRLISYHRLINYLNFKVYESICKMARLPSGKIIIINNNNNNKSACEFLNNLGRKIGDNTGDERSTSFLFQGSSVLIQRFNAVLLNDSFMLEHHLD